MGTDIYYFSGTGNSLIVAKNLATRINGTLIPIGQLNKNDQIIPSGNSVGVVFPVYLAQLYGLPEIVDQFLRKLDYSNLKYLFVLCTYGGYGVVNAFPTLNNCIKVVKSKGGIVSDIFWVRLPLNNLDYDHIPIPIQRNHDVIFTNAQKKLDKIGERIIKQKNSRYLYLNIVNLFLSPIYFLAKKPILQTLKKLAFEKEDSNLSFHDLIPLTDKSIEFDEDKCNGCGTCEKVCPVQNIKLINERPAWQHQCEMCFACDEWCSKKAIHHWGKIKGKDYHHPEITIKDMMKQNGDIQP